MQNFISHLAGLFGGAAALALSAFKVEGRYKLMRPIHSALTYAQRGRKTRLKKCHSSEAPKIPLLKAYDKCLERKMEYELLTPSLQR